ncbi:MAG TPA: hypothetical protein VF171_00075 [Trueperaceae bacterium]
MGPKPVVVPAVFDTSPLIFLDTLGYALRLPRIYRPYVTTDVVRELGAKPGAAGSILAASGLFEVRLPKPETLNRIQVEFSADPCETASIPSSTISAP